MTDDQQPDTAQRLEGLRESDLEKYFDRYLMKFLENPAPMISKVRANIRAMYGAVPAVTGESIQVMGYYFTHVDALVQADSGEALLGSPTCTIYYNTLRVAGPIDMTPNLLANQIPNWLCDFAAVYPKPNFAVVKATFVNYATFTSYSVETAKQIN